MMHSNALQDVLEMRVLFHSYILCPFTLLLSTWREVWKEDCRSKWHRKWKDVNMQARKRLQPRTGEGGRDKREVRRQQNFSGCNAAGCARSLFSRPYSLCSCPPLLRTQAVQKVHRRNGWRNKDQQRARTTPIILFNFSRNYCVGVFCLYVCYSTLRNSTWITSLVYLTLQ